MHPFSRRLITAVPAPMRPGTELLIRTVDDTFGDRVPGLSAEIAFWAMVSLPSLVVTLLGGVGLMGDLLGRKWQADAVGTMLDTTSLVLTADAQEALTRLLDVLVEENGGSVVTIGFVVTVFSASRALRALAVAITKAYDLQATRPGWKQRLWGLGLTVAGLLVAMLLGPVLIAGPEGGAHLSNLANGIPGLTEVWRALYWPGLGVTLTLLIAALYHFTAPWSTPFHRDFPGALLAMALWLVGSGGLRLYAGQVIGESYGVFALPLLLLLWLYVSGFAVLLGAELNAEIEKMWPAAPRTDAAAVPDPAATEPIAPVDLTRPS